MITIYHDDNILDIIDKFSKELGKYGFHVEDVSEEGGDCCNYEIVQNYIPPEKHHPDCNCKFCK